MGRSVRKKLSQEVTGGILEMIRKGEISLNNQIPTESELVDRFQVSRTVVREGVRGLVAIGVLETRPGIGTFVVDSELGPLRYQDGFPGQDRYWMDLLEVRRIVEPEMAALAAVRRTDEDLAELKRCVVELEMAVVKHYKPQEDMGFHLAIARATDNTAMVDISSLITRFYQNDPELPDQSDATAHRRVYEAILAGDANLARQAMLDHFGELEPRYSRYPLTKSE